MNNGSVLSSRDRILFSAKHLFARNGYENTSTVAIARQAGTSESQLMKHFGSKQGLLFAIFDHGWTRIAERVREARNGSGSPIDHLFGVLEALVIELERDPEMQDLMMLEARRVRKDNTDVSLSHGYLNLGATLDDILADLRNEGLLPPEINIKALRAACLGMAEGMIFDQVVAKRSGSHLQYNHDDIKRVLETMLSALAANHTEAMRSIS